MSQLLYILKKELVNNALITVLSYFLNTSNDNELYGTLICNISFKYTYPIQIIK